MHQVLARKYRPGSFQALVGQEHVSRALTSAISNRRLHHAYLFTGTRGVGKTTIARILAKCLNCETGITTTPCGVCNTCIAVDQGRFIDCIEIDAASRTRVEDTRELLDNVPYAPSQGRYKVYLIDEVHMLSTHSFNALLKTLEEPPEHVKFLLATTDPQKLPVTVLSRCLQFNLRPLSQKQIEQHLITVLEQESIPFEPAALWQLADAAQGSLRDALSVTDQAITHGQGSISTAGVQSMLGILDQQLIVQLLAALFGQDRTRLAGLMVHLQSEAVDVDSILDQLTAMLHHIAMRQTLPGLSHGYSPDVEQQLEPLLQVPAAEIQLFYEIVLKGREQLKLALNPLQGLEMTLLRMLAFSPALTLPEHYPASSPVLPDAAKKKPLTETAAQTPIKTDFAPHTVEPSAEDHSTVTSATVDDTITVSVSQQNQISRETLTVMPALAEQVPSLEEEAIIFAEPLVAPVISSWDTDLTANQLDQPAPDEGMLHVDQQIPADQDPPQLPPVRLTDHSPVEQAQTVVSPVPPLHVATPSATYPPHAEPAGENGWTAARWSDWVHQQSLQPLLHNVCLNAECSGSLEKMHLCIEQSQQLIFEQVKKALFEHLQQAFRGVTVDYSFEEGLTDTPYQLKLINQQLEEQALMDSWQQRPEIRELEKMLGAKLEKVEKK